MAINATILTVVTAICQAVVALFSYLLAVHNTKNDKSAKKEQKIETANDKLDDVCDNGNINDLLDATKKVKEAKK